MKVCEHPEDDFDQIARGSFVLQNRQAGQKSSTFSAQQNGVVPD